MWRRLVSDGGVLGDVATSALKPRLTSIEEVT